MGAPGSWTIPYRALPGGSKRPYLGLELTGPNGRHGAVLGIVDTGADTTSLPAGYAGLMGYDDNDLNPVLVQQVQGTVSAWEAKVPCKAVVVGLEQFAFELRPLFVEGSLSVLWGRADFMSEFAITITEAAQEFTLHR